MQAGELSTIAYELSQPVNALALLTYSLGRYVSETPDTADLLRSVNGCLLQLHRQHATLLDYLLLEQKERALARVVFPLEPLIERLVLNHMRTAEEQGVRLRVVGSPVHVFSDPAAVEIILGNLLLNAILFSPGGKVLIGCRRAGENVSVQVCDNGLGIPADKLGVIFQPLVKLPGDRDDATAGLGLGLAIVDRLTKALGHRLTVRSTLGKGSVFSLLLPHE